FLACQRLSPQCTRSTNRLRRRRTISCLADVVVHLQDIELRQRAEAAFCAPRMSNWLLKLRWTDWICIQFVWKGTASKWSFLSNPSDWRRCLYFIVACFVQLYKILLFLQWICWRYGRP
ncbi:hypothetical protein M514_14636, partial [Trichuris suis]